MHQLRISEKHKVALVPFDQRVANLIPHTKPFKQNNKDFLLVPTGKDELQLLRNLGYSAPSPLDIDYDWAGVVPFKAQTATTDMLVHNRRAYVLNDMGCFDGETEYLTQWGWKKFKDYDGESSECVASYEPKTGGIVFVDRRADDFVKKKEENFIHIKTSRGIDQMVSPEHRVLLHSTHSGGKKTETVAAEELYRRSRLWLMGERSVRGRSIVSFSDASIPTACATSFIDYHACGSDSWDLHPYSGGQLLPNPYFGDGPEYAMRVIIAVMADGHFPNNSDTCVIRLKKGRKKYRLRMLLDKAGIPFTEKDCQPEGFSRFSFTAPLRVKSGEELLGMYDKDGIYGGFMDILSMGRMPEVICDEILHWDGSTDGTRFRFSTTSKAWADIVQVCFVACGYTARVTTVDRTDEPGHNLVDYVVTPRGKKELGIKGLSSEGERYTNITEVIATGDSYKYCWSVPSTYLVTRRNGCVAMSGNTGKTLSALFAFDYLKKKGHANKMLVVAPLSTLTCVWEREVFSRMPHLTCQSLWHAQSAKRKEFLKREADIYVINHDGVKTILPELQARTDLDVMVIDELAIFRNKRTDLWKKTNILAKQKKWVWGMTGSVTPMAPTDAWGQIMMLTPERTEPSFKKFRDKTMTRVTQFKWIAKQEAMDTVLDQMKPAVRFLRGDCVDLPPTTTSERTVKLTDTQQKLYDAVLKQNYALFLDKEITAMNAAIVQNKLLQISAGFAYANNEKIVEVPATPRMELTYQTIEQCQNKVLVFAPFTHAVDMLEKYLLDKGVDVAKIYGQTKKKDRDAIFNAFQDTKQYKVIVAHAGTMAHGLTLTAADTIIWYSPTSALDLYEQANARITRPGQKAHTHIIHIQATKVEEKAYKTLMARGNAQNTLLEMFEEQTEQSGK